MRTNHIELKVNDLTIAFYLDDQPTKFHYTVRLNKKDP